MFGDLCVVTDADTALFLALCIAAGALLGITIAWIIPRRLRKHQPKIGCLAMLFSGVAAWAVTERLFPDPRDHGDICGWTPEVVFYPLFAFIAVPFALAISAMIALKLRRKRGEK